MRTLLIVMLAKLRQLLPHVVQRREPFHVQTLVAQPAVETLDESVLHRTAWPNEAQLHFVAHGPGFHRATAELAAVVHRDAFRQAASFLLGTFECLDYLHPRHRAIGFQLNALPRELIHHGQNAERSPVRQLIAHKIHAPAVVRSYSYAGWHGPSSRHLPSLFRSYNQAFLPVQSIDALGIHMPAFAPQQHRPPAIAVAHVRSRHLPQTMAQHFIKHSPAPVAQRPDRQLNQPRRMPLADPVGLLRPARQLPTRTRPYAPARCWVTAARGDRTAA